jgi:ribA/ribD-fused uncharacterized protein
MIKEFQGPYRWLSNFYPCSIEYEGETYGSVEAAFQAAKNLDPQVRKTFVNLQPNAAKRKGRLITLRPDWLAARLDVMRDLLRIKFKDPMLRQKLLDTQDEHLQEGNTWNDRFWGVCDDKGQNNLGKLLMQVRAEIRK